MKNLTDDFKRTSKLGNAREWINNLIHRYVFNREQNNAIAFGFVLGIVFTIAYMWRVGVI